MTVVKSSQVLRCFRNRTIVFGERRARASSSFSEIARSRATFARLSSSCVVNSAVCVGTRSSMSCSVLPYSQEAE